MEKKTVFFPNLDGLRFFAFLAVFFAHTFYSELAYIQSDELYQSFRFFGHHGTLGVNFFFVLSGFLITYLLLEEEKSAGKINIRNFYIRRILRIWPLYYAVVFIGYVLFPYVQSFFGNEIEESNLIYYLFFISNYKPEPAESAVLGILWSIAVEEQFYLIWPLIVAFIPYKNLQWSFFFIVLSSLIFRTFISGNIYEDSLACMSDLAIGSWTAYLAFERKKLTDFIKKLSKRTIAFLYLLGFLLIFMKELWNDIHIIHSNERLVFSIFFAFIILEQNYAENSLFKMSQLKIISQLGKYTYGLYMLHFVAIYVVFKIFTILNLNTLITQVLIFEPIIALFLSIGLAFGSYHILEKPFLKIKKKYAKIIKD